MQDFNHHNTGLHPLHLSLIAGAFILLSGMNTAAAQESQCSFKPMLSCSDSQGNRLWSDETFQDASTFAEDQTRLFISQSGRAYALSRQDGRKLWEARTETDALYFYPVIAGESVYLTRTDGVLEKRQAGSGIVIWRSQPGNGWVYPPVRVAGQLFTAGQDSIIWEINSQTGSAGGRFKLEQELVAPLVVNGDLLIAATFDGKLTAYRPEQGTKRLLETVWQTDIGTAVFDIRSVGNTLIVSDMGGQISSLGAGNGNIQWQLSVHNNARYWNTIDRESLYSLSNTGALYIIDLQSGKPLDQQQFSGEFSRAPIVQDDAIVLFDIHGVNKGDALSASPKRQSPLSMAFMPATPYTPKFNQSEE